MWLIFHLSIKINLYLILRIIPSCIHSTSNQYRLLATAPSVKKTIWGLTEFVMANLHKLFIPRFVYGDDFDDGKESENQFKSMYDDDPLLKHFSHIEHRKSIMSLTDVDESDFEVRGGMLSRRNSILSGGGGGRNSVQPPCMVSSLHSTADVDTLDQVVNVAAHHDTLYSYHYIDETDKTVSVK